MKFASETLTARHRLDTFECGKPELDMWLKQSASHAKRMRTCRTFVWCTRPDHSVVAYYGLAAHQLERNGIGPIGRGSPSAIPAVLLARLALDRKYHGQQLGSVLLADALRRALKAGTNVGARFVAVDAIDDGAADFYATHGFVRVPGDPHRLVRKMSAIEADFGS